MHLLWCFQMCKHWNTCSPKATLKRETEKARNNIRWILFKGRISDNICAPTVGFFSLYGCFCVLFQKVCLNRNHWSWWRSPGIQSGDIPSPMALLSLSVSASVTLPYPSLCLLTLFLASWGGSLKLRLFNNSLSEQRSSGNGCHRVPLKRGFRS